MFHVKQDRKESIEKDDPTLKVKDYLVSGETFELHYDKEYNLLKTEPQPSPSEIGRYYESESYISHTDSKKGLLNFVYQTVKSFSLKRKCGLITKLNNGTGRLLDVGAGTGDFLHLAKNQGWEVAGMEVNAQARKRASEKGISLSKDWKQLEEGKFDVITLWHVLEHLHDLEAQVEKLGSLLKDKGSLVIAVPNFRSYDAQHYGHYWAAYDVPRHLWHFSRSSIPKLFSGKAKLESMHPMIFDSYYVSLLSEKYKTGKGFSMKAFWIGFLSNWRARRTKEHSSIIYCLRKA